MPISLYLHGVQGGGFALAPPPLFWQKPSLWRHHDIIVPYITKCSPLDKCLLTHSLSDASKWQLWLNVWSQISHANGFTPCGSLHDSSSDNCGWMLHHIFHMQMPSLHVGLFMTLQVTIMNEWCITYFSCKWLHSMWVATWLLNWQLWLNVRSHILHVNGFTPCGSQHDSSTDNCAWM